MTAAGLTVNEQAQGQTVSYKYFDVPQLPYPNQGQGIIGFAGPKSSSFHPPSNSWFYNLCENKAISTCKLGLLFGKYGEIETHGYTERMKSDGNLRQVLAAKASSWLASWRRSILRDRL